MNFIREYENITLPKAFTFLALVGKLQEATTSSSYLFVHPHKPTRLSLDRFSRNSISEYFSKIYRKFQDLLISGKEQRVLSAIQIRIHDDTSLNFIYNEKFSRKIEDNIKRHILFSGTYFFKSCTGYEKCGKYCTAREGTVDNAHCMLDTWVYRHTLRLCNAVVSLQQWLH